MPKYTYNALAQAFLDKDCILKLSQDEFEEIQGIMQ
jgi:hypothetical protein